MDDLFLTYDEAAARLGIKPDSVRRRARLKKWPRRTGNDGRVRVGIPPDILPPDDQGDHPEESPPIDIDVRMENGELRVEVRMLKEQIETLRQERDSWKHQAERLSVPRPGLISQMINAIKGK